MKALNNMLTYVSCLLFSVSTALYILFFFTHMVFAFITPSSAEKCERSEFFPVQLLVRIILSILKDPLFHLFFFYSSRVLLQYLR
jgi:hypothetical protein